MPYVNIRLTEGVSVAQKAELIARTTQMLVEMLGKDPATTIVVIDELPSDNWGVGGETITSRRARTA